MDPNARDVHVTQDLLVLNQNNYYYTLNKIINAPCGTLKLLLALGVAKYIKSYKINFVVQYATDYCPLEHDNYKTISAHLGSPISCYINNLHGAFIFLLSIFWLTVISIFSHGVHAIGLTWQQMLNLKGQSHSSAGFRKIHAKVDVVINFLYSTTM